MINLQFPPNFEEAIMKTQIVVQETQTIRYLKEAKQIEAETKRLEAQIQKTIITETVYNFYKKLRIILNLIATNKIKNRKPLKRRLPSLINLPLQMQLDQK